MTKSALQIARAAYQPKLPKALKGAVKVKEGEPTQSVADQEAIKALFPNTYGMPLIQFVEGEAVNMPAINVGDRKSTRLNSSHIEESRMPSSA